VTSHDCHAELIIQDDGSSESSEGSEFGGAGADSDAASSVASSEDSESASDCKLLRPLMVEPS
jgi:hypothetical protein